MNTQDSVRYALQPFQKLNIRLDGVDRTNGDLFASAQADSLYIEKTDYPFLFTLVTQGSGDIPFALIPLVAVLLAGLIVGAGIARTVLLLRRPRA